MLLMEEIKKKIIYWLKADNLANFRDDDSERQIKETDKMRTFVCIKKWTDQDDDAPMIIKTKKDNRCKHCCKVRDDWDFTVYMYRDWQPLNFFKKWVKWRE